MINLATIQGNLTKDPELTTTPSGVEVAKFSIAWNEKYKDKEKVEFYNCVAWRQTGVFISKHFKKGNPILVEGHFETRTYDDKDGIKRYSTELIVDRAHFCGGKSDNGQAKPDLNELQDKLNNAGVPGGLDGVVGNEKDLPF